MNYEWRLQRRVAVAWLRRGEFFMSARCRDQRSAAVRGDGRLVQDLAQLEAQLEPTGMLTRREKNAGGVG